NYSKFFRKTVTAVCLLSVLAGLFGCGKTQHYNVSQISAVSISCCHMDRRYGYSFFLREENGQWLFDADCFTDDHENETVLENKAVGDDDISVLLDIIERNETVKFAETYKKPKQLFEALDESTYSLCLTFDDGSRYNADSIGSAMRELESFFYRLAESD
ncbi:MAG: hypothetical protein ACI4XH_10885, partial [Acutalibacteraceae bacterium]